MYMCVYDSLRSFAASVVLQEFSSAFFLPSHFCSFHIYFSVMVFVPFDGGSKLGSVFVTAMLVLLHLGAAWLPRVATSHISGVQPSLTDAVVNLKVESSLF